MCLIKHSDNLTCYFTYTRAAIKFLENIPEYLHLNEGNEGTPSH